MISLLLECDGYNCGSDQDMYVDVYHDHWVNKEPLGEGWLPEGWVVKGHDVHGYPLVYCPNCADFYAH